MFAVSIRSNQQMSLNNDGEQTDVCGVTSVSNQMVLLAVVQP